MKRLIEFPLEGGGSVLVEQDTDEEQISGLVPAARGEPGEKLHERAAMTFQEAVEKIKPTAEAIIHKLRSLSDPPDETTVEFGLKLTAASGVVVAAAGIEANYKITLKWQRKGAAKTTRS